MEVALVLISSNMIGQFSMLTSCSQKGFQNCYDG